MQVGCTKEESFRQHTAVKEWCAVERQIEARQYKKGKAVFHSDMDVMTLLVARATVREEMYSCLTGIETQLNVLKNANWLYLFDRWQTNKTRELFRKLQN